MKKKTFIVQLLNSKKPSRTSFTQVEDALFYSNDTDASLVFLPHEDTFDFQSAKVVMFNRGDESLVERDMEVTTEDGRKVASYELPDEIISHWGQWIAQPVFINDDEIYSGAIVPFSVDRHLMHERPPKLTEVVTVTKFVQQSQELVNAMIQAEAQRITEEQVRQSSEENRVQAENERSDKYESYAQQFNDVITELSEEKDYHSLPEIAGARGGFDTLGERLSDTTTQLALKAQKEVAESAHARIDNLVIPLSPENANIAVTDAQVSTVKNKTFLSIRDRLEESEDDLIQHQLDYASRFPETNIPINLLETQTIKDNGYWSETNTFLNDVGFFTIEGFIPIEQNIKYSNNFYNARLYDANDSLVGVTPNNTNSIIINDGVTTKIRPNFKKADTSSANAYIYKIGFKSDNLVVNLGNLDKNILEKIEGGLNDKTETFPTSKFMHFSCDDFITPLQDLFLNGVPDWELGYVSDTGAIGKDPSNYHITSSYVYLNKDDVITVEGENGVRASKWSLNNGAFTFVSRTSSYAKQYIADNDGYYRFSITPDTPIEIINDNNKIELSKKLKIPNNRYNSLFEQPVFKFLKDTHDRYGITFSAYLIYQNTDNSFNLSMLQETYKKEFTDNSNWLKLGYHTNSLAESFLGTSDIEALALYNKMIGEIVRFTGSYKCIDRMPRLHNYEGNLASLKAIKNAKGGIVGLLTAEDTRTNYYHSVEQTNRLLNYDRLYDNSNDLFFMGTDIRLDNTEGYSILELRKNDINYKNRMNDLILFMHDAAISSVGIQNRILSCCEFAIENGYRFDFPMNVVMG